MNNNPTQHPSFEDDTGEDEILILEIPWPLLCTIKFFSCYLPSSNHLPRSAGTKPNTKTANPVHTHTQRHFPGLWELSKQYLDYLSNIHPIIYPNKTLAVC